MDCDILGVKPSIAVIPPQSAVEGGTFQLELGVSEVRSYSTVEPDISIHSL